jgi:hypothetical protein
VSTKDNEVNRTIDGETAEGHRVRQFGEAEDAGKRTAKRQASLDDEAEGHRVRQFGEADENTKRI